MWEELFFFFFFLRKGWGSQTDLPAKTPFKVSGKVLQPSTK